MATVEEIEEKIRRRNENLLYNFKGWMKRAGLSERVSNNHSDNIDFFINEYLIYASGGDELYNAEDGIDEVDYFLGDWFIRKAMWSSESSIKSNIRSIKKFYTFMESLHLISKEELKELNQSIKENKEEWLKAVRNYNDLDIDYDDVW